VRSRRAKARVPRNESGRGDRCEVTASVKGVSEYNNNNNNSLRQPSPLVPSRHLLRIPVAVARRGVDHRRPSQSTSTATPALTVSVSSLPPPLLPGRNPAPLRPQFHSFDAPAVLSCRTVWERCPCSSWLDSVLGDCVAHHDLHCAWQEALVCDRYAFVSPHATPASAYGERPVAVLAITVINLGLSARVNYFQEFFCACFARPTDYRS
jgi:hypothetical protein